MTSPRRAVALALAAPLLALALAGCVGDDVDPTVQPPGQQPPDRMSQSPSASASGSASPTATGTPYDGPVADSPTCAEVVEGINAFNESDFASTVAHFQAAVPLAEAADDGSRAAGELLDAVRYYATLAPEDYPTASRTSLDFAQYKAITLGMCVGDGDLQLPTPTSPGLSA